MLISFSSVTLLMDSRSSFSSGSVVQQCFQEEQRCGESGKYAGELIDTDYIEVLSMWKGVMPVSYPEVALHS